MGWKARAHDGRYFRRPSPAERAILDRARADLLRGWDTDDENLKTSAYLTLRKTLEPMEIPGAQTERMRYSRRRSTLTAQKKAAPVGRGGPFT